MVTDFIEFFTDSPSTQLKKLIFQVDSYFTESYSSSSNSWEAKKQELESSSNSRNSRDERVPPFSNEIWIYIFSYLSNCQDVLNASLVCSVWNDLILNSENSQIVWKELLKREFDADIPLLQLQLSRQTQGNLKSGIWKSIFIQFHNFKNAQFQFYSIKQDFNATEGVTLSKDDAIIDECTSAYIHAWPVDPSNAFWVVLDKSILYWLEPYSISDPYRTIIHGLDLKSPNIVFQIMGHSYRIILILGNGAGYLLSFDEGGWVRIWDTDKKSFKTSVNTRKSHKNTVSSVEIYGNRFITVDKSLYASIWDIETGCILYNFLLPVPLGFDVLLLPSVNVTMNHLYIAYGFEDGSYFVIPLPTDSPRDSPRDFSKDSSIDSLALREKLICFQHSHNLHQEHGFTYAPQTISLYGNTLITNGTFPDELSVWDIKQQCLLFHHSETSAMAFQSNYHMPLFRDLGLATIRCQDGFMTGSAKYEGQTALFIWDFTCKTKTITSSKRENTLFYKKRLRLGYSMEVWICVSKEL